MPYINPKRRQNFDQGIEHLAQEIENGGDLQYVIAELADRLLQTLAYGSNHERIRYTHCEQVFGALNGAAHEFYRVVQGPYEEIAIHNNGPCYGFARGAIRQAQWDNGMVETGPAFPLSKPTLQSVE